MHEFEADAKNCQRSSHGQSRRSQGQGHKIGVQAALGHELHHCIIVGRPLGQAYAIGNPSVRL